MSSNPRLAKQMLERHMAGLHDDTFVKLVTGPPHTHVSGLRDELDQVLATMRYAVDGWRFELHAEPAMWTQGLARTLRVTLTTANSDDPSQTIHVTHIFAVPPADLAARTIGGATAFWARWLLDRILDVQCHEAMENLWFDDERPFYPEHGSGSSPYRVTYHHV